MSHTRLVLRIVGVSAMGLTAAVFGWLAVGSTAAATSTEVAHGLVQRLVGDKADRFVFRTIPKEDGHDVFELESRDGKIVIGGSTGVAMASGWSWYLKHYAHCQVSLWGNNLALPEPLPAVPEKVRRVSPFKYRYYLNFCAFSYSLAWWDWSQWQRLIDWMAMQGINAPLSVTGQEAIWHKVYRDLGLSDKQIGEFFVGPGYLPFGWMGCMDGWGGPLPKSWIDSHLELQKKIVARQRDLGMTPILQGFTGHVPASLKEAIPDAKLLRLPSWNGFPPTHFLDPQDPLFLRIGKLFIEEQTRQFGTDHLYASDTFIEMTPPSSDPEFLTRMSKSVYEAMRVADPDAVWVMQTWMFSFQRKFWKAPQSRALLSGVPDGRMILLDLNCESSPVWDKTESFYGKPWIWNIIQDFGNLVSLHGGLPQISGNLKTAMTSPNRGQLVGIGMVNEGLGYNPVVNDFLGEMAWRTEVPELAEWVRGHVTGRYGSCPAGAQAAWDLLLKTAYRAAGSQGTPICVRPNPRRGSGCAPHWGEGYDNAQLARAWEKLLACSGQLGGVDTYRFDLVNVARQVMANLGYRFHKEINDAYRLKDRKALSAASDRHLQLIRDMDRLLATRKEFLLGQWLADAKRWATNDQEKRLYEWNARNIITLWGPPDSALHEYANKQWSGLLSSFHLPRWEMFLKRLGLALEEGKPFDERAWEQATRDWEAQWTRQTDSHPTEPSGDCVAVARELWNEYAPCFTPTKQETETKKERP